MNETAKDKLNRLKRLCKVLNLENVIVLIHSQICLRTSLLISFHRASVCGAIFIPTLLCFFQRVFFFKFIRLFTHSFTAKKTYLV